MLEATAVRCGRLCRRRPDRDGYGNEGREPVRGFRKGEAVPPPLLLPHSLDELDEAIGQLCALASPALLAAPRVGPEVASALLVAAGGNPGRLRTEASFAALCGTSPVQASSGKISRHRLNQGVTVAAAPRPRTPAPDLSRIRAATRRTARRLGPPPGTLCPARRRGPRPVPHRDGIPDRAARPQLRPGPRTGRPGLATARAPVARHHPAAAEARHEPAEDPSARTRAQP
jgi:Transposase IS116/IS110/IS902 family